MSDILALQLFFMVCATVGFTASLRFVRRILEMKHERALHAPPPDLDARLDRIELAVETTALEVERIAEANRFVAKLLADRATPQAPSSKPPRVITPH